MLWIYLHIVFVYIPSNSTETTCIEHLIKSQNITREHKLIKMYVEGIADQFVKSSFHNTTLQVDNKESPEPVFKWIQPFLSLFNGNDNLVYLSDKIKIRKCLYSPKKRGSSI